VVVNPYTTWYTSFQSLLKTLNPGHMKLVVWDRATVRMPVHPGLESVQELVRIAFESSVRVTGVFGPPPHSLFPRGELGALPGGGAALFLRPREMWEGMLETLLTLRNLSEMVKTWQISRDEDVQLLGAEEMTQAWAAWRRTIERQEKFARFGTPSKIETLSRLPKDVDFVSIPLTANEPIPDLKDWVRRLHVSLRLPDGLDSQTPAGRVALVQDLVRGTAQARYALGPDTPIFVPLVAAAHGSLLDAEGLPTPAFVTFLLINDFLGEASPAPDLQMFDPPVKVLLFQRSGKVVGVAWSEESTSIEAFLGQGALLINPMGHQRELGIHQKVELGPMPTFIVGADGDLLRTQASLRFEPDFIPLKEAITDLRLKFQNHLSTAMRDLTVKLAPVDPNWVMNPSTIHRPRLDSGAWFEEKIRFSLPQTFLMERGGVNVVLEFHRDTGGGLELYRVPVTRMVGLVVTPRMMPSA
jgi:hypothetical protein